MASYTDLFKSIDSVFASEIWLSTGVKAFPMNYYPKVVPKEFVRYEVLPAGNPTDEYGSANYKSGLIIVQIYCQSSTGPSRVFEIADILKSLMERQTIVSTQVSDGSLELYGVDKDDISLFRADYSLQFNSF